MDRNRLKVAFSQTVFGPGTLHIQTIRLILALARTTVGEPCEWLGMCTYEFRDGKIQEVRTAYDRLTLIQQLTTGWLERKIVDAVARQAESGLQ